MSSGMGNLDRSFKMFVIQNEAFLESVSGGECETAPLAVTVKLVVA